MKYITILLLTCLFSCQNVLVSPEKEYFNNSLMITTKNKFGNTNSNIETPMDLQYSTIELKEGRLILTDYTNCNLNINATSIFANTVVSYKIVVERKSKCN